MSNQKLMEVYRDKTINYNIDKDRFEVKLKNGLTRHDNSLKVIKEKIDNFLDNEAKIKQNPVSIWLKINRWDNTNNEEYDTYIKATITSFYHKTYGREIECRVKPENSKEMRRDFAFVRISDTFERTKLNEDRINTIDNLRKEIAARYNAIEKLENKMTNIKEPDYDLPTRD